MIILITGQPGSGKTALCVDMLAHDDQFKSRPMFVGGVPDLTLVHEPVPPVAEWTELRTSPEDESLKLAYFTFPAQSVIVVDEAQRIYRPRSTGSKVPPEVAAFETHRHTGVDFILLTQHPGLLDANIRKLVGKHIHIAVTPFGRYRYEWTKCVDPESKAEREIASRSRYDLPKRAFKLYKSSELHTKIKTRLPAYVYVFALALIAVIGMSYYIYGRIFSKFDTPTVAKINAPNDSPGHASQGNAPSAKQTLREYHESHAARVAGLHHTASRYDDVTKPNDAPWPVGCVQNKNRCRCIDQQGNTYATTPDVCRSVVADGIFKDWESPQDKQAKREPQDAPKARQAAPVKQAASEVSTSLEL